MSMFELASLGVVCRPIGVNGASLSGWPVKPTPAHERLASPFRQTLGDTAAMLARELRHLRKPGAAIVLELALREQDIRQDGLPRSDARMTHPGVILSFESIHGPLRLYTDACMRWEHNLRAIAFHLEHLRMAGIYGVGKSGQQYTGWKALPPPQSPQDDRKPRTADEAAALLTDYTEPRMTVGTILTDRDAYASAFRQAAFKTHPDAKGGSDAAFVAVTAARTLLDAHFGM